MLKVIGIILILAGCSAMGIYYAYLVNERYANSERVKKALICLRGEIRFGHTPLPEALESVANHSNGIIKRFFWGTAAELKKGTARPFVQIWEEQVAHCFTGNSLHSEIITEMKELGQTLGFLDREMQVNTLNLYLERVEVLLERQNREKREKIRLYQLLGVMGGVFLTILII